ncbi:MAG: CoA transferase [Acidimicrobiales bacterium]|nr:CoA transferase [Acidimicrobiales bacterium]
MLDDPGNPGGPLVGLRIIDVTHAAAGPYATMMLADLGADVIKIEPPGGEFTRYARPFLDEDTVRHYGGRFANRNRNKRAMVLDLADDADRATFLELVETADGLVENLRGGVLDRLGVGWEVCHARNPRLVYAAIRGFGDARTGASPYAQWPAYDVVAQAMGGVVATTGPGPEQPMRAGPLVGDLVPGLMAALGLVSALLHAQRGGEGQFLDVAMVDAVMSLGEPAQSSWDYLGRDYPPSANAVDDVTPFDVYPTADGHCAIAAPTDALWRLLCEAIGRPELAGDERTLDNTARVEHRSLVDGAVGAWAAARTSAEVMEALGGKVPVGPVYRARDWVGEPHVVARRMLIEVEHPHHRPTTQLGCPIKFTATQPTLHRGPPLLDEHGEEVRAELARRRAAGAP